MRCDVRRKFLLRLNGTFGGRTFCKPLRCRDCDTSAVRTTCGKVCRTFSKFLVQQGFRKRSGSERALQMGFVMPKPKSLKSGALTARQVIPTDVREEYQRLYGKAW